MVVMFGRRRVGKTFLLQNFGATVERPTRYVYYPATRDAPTLQRTLLAERLSADGVDTAGSTGSWGSLLASVFDAAREEPLVVVIDEAPYLIDGDPAWPSVVQHLWDAEQTAATPSKLLLILNGSAISSMTSIVASQGALYGRPSAMMRIEPFDLPMTHEYLGRPHPVVSIEAHAACGGYPLLLGQWNTDADAPSNLIRLAGSPLGALAENARTLLIDVADTKGNHLVLGAIGRGATKLAEITNRAGLRAEHPLEVMSQAGFIGRRTPLGEPARKNIRYDLLDGYLRFWFSIVDRNIQLIEGGQGAAVIRGAEQLWIRHVADTFERAARDHAVRLVADSRLGDMLIGEWWSDSGVQGQVDVVGLNGKHWTLAGEVKWADSFGRADLNQLLRNITISRREDDAPLLASWSRDGPSSDVRTLRPSMVHYTAADIVE